MIEQPSPALPSMTVVRLDVDSFKRLKAAHVEPSPTGLIPVRGRNSQGKSSLIESMLAALTGKAGKVELPILEGQHGASVVVDLGELVVCRRWTRGSDGKAKTSLTVEDAKGRPKRGPQAVLDDLMGRLADPVAFMGMKAADQVKKVLGVLGLDKQLDLLEAEEEEAMLTRTDVGRDLRRLDAAFAELDAELAGIPAPKVSESVETLTARLQAAQRSNASRDTLEASCEAAKALGGVAVARKARLLEEIAALEIEAEEQRVVYSDAAKLFNETALIDTASIIEALGAHEDNAKHTGRLELLGLKSTERDAAKVNHAAAETNVKEIRAEIAKLLGEVQFPVPGMAYDQAEKFLTLNGIPLSQISQGEQVRVSAAVAMSGNPVIRVLFAREGSLLDEESRMQLAELAEASGFQLWLEVVDSTREGSGVWVEDGEVFQNGEA